MTGWQRNWPPGWSVEHVDETTSTNAALMAVGPARPDRSVLAAGHQTAGRGRLDRRWEAPADVNLLASLLFHVVPADPGELTRRVSLAALDACRAASTLGALTLKWPNDILAGGAKVAGVLAQRDANGAVVVGVGVNVGWCPAGAAMLGPGIHPADVLATLLLAFDALAPSTSELMARYRGELDTLGRRVRLELPGGGELAGTASDVTADGRLVVLDDCAVTHRVAVADVVHATVV